jgi:arylsulfatase A-like enzyme
MLTGRYPLTTGVLGNRTWYGYAHPDFESLPLYFKKHGYATLRSGKIFHGGLDETEAWTEGGDQRVFDLRDPQRTANPEHLKRVVSEDRRADAGAAERAVELLRQYRGKRFLLACGFAKPHTPLEAPRFYRHIYDQTPITLPPDFAPRPTVPAGFPPAAIREKNADLFMDGDATPEKAVGTIRAYLGCISWMDANVGKVLGELDRLKLREKTIIVFWGDHGYQLGEKGKWSKAGSLYEQGTRVPLIIELPGAAGNGKTCPRIVESNDINPTLVELCGLTPPAGLQGRSRVPLLDDPEAEWNRPAFTIWSENGTTATGISVRVAGWRYSEYAGPRGGAVLFDEQADPHEMKNLADDPRYAQVRERLAKLIEEHRKLPAMAGG